MRDGNVGGSLSAYAQRAGRGTIPRPHLRLLGEQAPPCRFEPELFFAESPDDIRRAKALCGACPVQSACLAGALRRGEPWGVWGGALFLRGAIIPDKRPRGRPRRSDAARALAVSASPPMAR